MDDQPITVFNNGNMKRDFTYITDIVKGIRFAIDNNYKCDIFNLGNNKSEKLMDVIAIIEQELGMKAKIDFQQMQLGDVKQTYADIEHSKERIGYEPTTNIKTGIPKFVDWYKKYYNA